MLKHEIFKKFEEHLQYVINEVKIPKERIVGIFLYGSQNYGTDMPLSDVDTKVIIIPSLDDIIVNKNFISNEITLKDGSHIDIKDIRAYRENLLKQNINYVETLFTEYFLLNPEYKDIFRECFLQKREEIARIDMRRSFMAAVKQASHTLNQYKGDSKKYYNAKRLLYFCEKYLALKPYLECIKFEKESEEYQYLMNIRIGKINPSEEDIKILKNQLEEMEATIDSRYPKAISLNKDNKEILDCGIRSLLKRNILLTF